MVKTEEQIVETSNSSSSLRLWEEAWIDFSGAQGTMYLVSSLNKVDFQNLIIGNDFGSEENNQEYTDFVVIEPPYNIQLNHAEVNSGRHKFTWDEVNAMVSFCRETVEPRSLGHLFCSTWLYCLRLRESAKDVEELGVPWRVANEVKECSALFPLEFSTVK